DIEYAAAASGLSRHAYGRFETARMAAAWPRGHRRRFALMSGGVVVASARERRVTASLNQEPVPICGISHVFPDVRHGGGARTQRLVEHMLAAAEADGARA